MFISYLFPVLLASMGASKLVRQGWLDKMVAYHRQHFLMELARLPPITVTLEKAPAGFVDSPKWDKQSVLRLVMLVEVLDARPARQAIRRALSPSRRFYLPPGKNTFDLFPSWSKNHPNNFEYDDMVQYDEKLTLPPQDDVVTDDTVVYISNPVEARLPASRVSVRLLREIMEERAIGLRQMPSSTRSTFSWTPKASQRTEASTAASNAPKGSEASGSTGAGAETTAPGNDAEQPASNDTATAAGTDTSAAGETTAEDGAETTAEETTAAAE